MMMKYLKKESIDNIKKLGKELGIPECKKYAL
jgi:hypothetical protein